MRDWKDIEKVYFLGIGGIGMSALARYIRSAGKPVAGYDRTRTELTDSLEKEGIPVHFSDDPLQIPSPFLCPNTTLVVYTPAVPSNGQEMSYFREKGFSLVKRSEILGMICREKPTVAVAGTHGKTSVTSLIAHILSGTKEGCIAFLGGISKNHNTNLIRKGRQEVFVAEADEFDRSFLQLAPYCAVITSMDADHLDVYGNHQQLKSAFAAFVTRIRKDGFLLIKKGLQTELPSGLKTYTYSATGPSDFYANLHSRSAGNFCFDLHTPGEVLRGLEWKLPGEANLENAVAATAIAWLMGTEAALIRSGLSGFTGVRRRFDIHIQTEKIVYMDDYAHHPAELKACIQAVRETWPGKEITGIFQPHLYSRTRDFAGGFAESLNLLDRCVLVDLYPAREEPIEGISSDTIRMLMKNPEKVVRCRKEQIVEKLRTMKPEVVLTMGAGDIDTQVKAVKNWLETNIVGKTG